MNEQTMRQIEWLLLQSEIEDGVVHIPYTEEAPDVFTKEEWEWVTDVAEQIMLEGGTAYIQRKKVSQPDQWKTVDTRASNLQGDSNG